MDDGETNAAVSGADDPATAALERLVDPAVAIEDGEVVVANEAAIDAFDLPADIVGSRVDRALEPVWGELAAAFDDVPAGTVRTVPLTDDRFDARIHRDTDGATITFDRIDESPTRDRVLKDRAMNEAPVGITIADPSLEDNPLIYVNDAFERLTGYPAEAVLGRNCRFLQGDGSDPEAVARMREAIDDERPVTVEVRNYRADGTEFWNEVTIAPVEDESGAVTHYVGFQNDVTARKEAEFESERRTAQVRAERAELERVLARVEGLVQDVTARVTGAASRTDLETTVCERIADEPTYDGAWIGENNPSTNGVDVSASAGEVGPTPIGADHPATVALREDAVTIDRDGGAVAAFPLAYDDVAYGVLVVQGSDPDAIDDREAVILTALARAVASGINARETSRILATDTVVAVELDLVDETVVPVALSALADCELEYHRSLPHDDGETASLFTVRGTEVDALIDAATDVPADVRPIVERPDGGLIELATDEPAIVERLSDRGANVRAIEAEAGQARVAFEVARSANVRSIVEDLEDRHPGTTVRSFRQRDRTVETRQEFAARVESELTDRQLDALGRAYHAGYFEWPRPTSGEELAASMGVSRPTFHEHLRAAEGKLCGALFDDE